MLGLYILPAMWRSSSDIQRLNLSVDILTLHSDPKPYTSSGKMHGSLKPCDSAYCEWLLGYQVGCDSPTPEISVVVSDTISVQWLHTLIIKKTPESPFEALIPRRKAQVSNWYLPGGSGPGGAEARTKTCQAITQRVLDTVMGNTLPNHDNSSLCRNPTVYYTCT